MSQFRSPGPLSKRDVAEIKAFQMANDLQVDGKFGRQTKDAYLATIANLRARLERCEGRTVPLLILGFAVGCFVTWILASVVMP